MSFLNSMGRFFSSLLGLAQGKTERMTDKMVAANTDTIRSQFRKTKEDWNRDYTEMRAAVAELIGIRESKAAEIKKLNVTISENEQKMSGAIELFNKSQDERYKQAYVQLAEKQEQMTNRIAELEADIEVQDKNIETYKMRLNDLQKQIEALNKEEAETVADIISSQKIRELNDRLSGVASDAASKNLEVIRQAREKSKTVAKLSTELSNTNTTSIDDELKRAGAKSKYLSAFENATQPKKPTVVIEEPKQLERG